MNLYKQFQQLIPRDPMMVGTVTAHNTDGTSTVTLTGGGTLRARGQTVPIGSNAFTRAGAIEGPAPSLPTELIDI